MKIYLDTTIPSYASSRKNTAEVEITKRLLLRIKKGEFLPYASFVTIAELQKTEGLGKRQRLLAIFHSLKPTIIESSEKIAALAKEYLEMFLSKEKSMPLILRKAVFRWIWLLPGRFNFWFRLSQFNHFLHNLMPQNCVPVSCISSLADNISAWVRYMRGFSSRGSGWCLIMAMESGSIELLT